ncbi:PadR family transcriptional regulator [Halorubrum salipaludis]|uniref:PadR family transcriptional regulator n=1 Tax=Halorubrum salipaludis TaxID=2032630 RepID=A0A2A2FEP5_9EURY|nr:PadR family transcriptional regulator [Halorubrum salipaludis]PAU83310.1 PadR family transcriptional regulator [Halorubrum salipaludis]
MTKWLHSGRRRDLCALLYEAGELRAQSLKSRLESHYDERIDPGSFYATLTSLVESGFLDRRTEGIADVYALTDAGERALLDHYDWLSAKVGDGDGEGDGDTVGDGISDDDSDDDSDDGAGDDGPDLKD